MIKGQEGAGIGAITRFFSMFFILMSTSSYSANECKNLKVAFAENWFPVSFIETGQQGQIRGVAKDIISSLAEEHQVKLTQVNPISWRKANVAMNEGDIDVLAGHFWSNIRNEKWHISKPLFNSDIRVFYIENKVKLLNKMDLVGLNGMQPAAASYGDELDSFINDTLSVSAMRNNTTMILSLIKQQADYAIMERLDGLAHIFRLGLQQKIAISDFSLSELTVHFSFAKQSPCAHLFTAFNDSVEKYISEQQIKIMTNKASSYYFHMP